MQMVPGWLLVLGVLQRKRRYAAATAGRIFAESQARVKHDAASGRIEPLGLSWVTYLDWISALDFDSSLAAMNVVCPFLAVLGCALTS